VIEPIDPAGWLPRLERATSEFATVLASADLTRAVPGCPGWSLAELAGHLGNVHAWAEHAVVAGNPEAAEHPAPAGRADLTTWYRDRAGSLLATLTTTDPESPAWAFGLPGGRAGFWRRRQTHETAVHLWDAARSQGAQPRLDAALAVDGIDEIATVLFPRQVRLGRMKPLRQSVAMVATDADTYPLVFGGDGTATLRREAAVATVRAPAEVLLLLLWKRLPVDDERLVVTGDRAAYVEMLAHALTP